MKERKAFICQNCGYESLKWLGRCPNCGEWNTFVEEIQKKKEKNNIRKVEPLSFKDIESISIERIKTDIGEFDRVLGGGIVKGSLILIGGDPGIGKSTLLTIVSGAYSINNRKVLYVSGEESIYQVKMRMERLKVHNENVFFLSETEIRSIIEAVDRFEPELLIIDSIQTMYSDEIDLPAGSVSQVRDVTLKLMNLSKNSGITTMIIGHITKTGVIAGPKTLEHMVDTVLYLEGDTNYMFRILRTVKNRFGSTNEIGVFELTEEGLKEVANPSSYLIQNRVKDEPGNTIVPTIQGTRAILVEIQSLITPARYGVPMRVSTGVDFRRLNMLIAIIEKRLGYAIGNYDIFCNIAGGIKIMEPSIDTGLIFSIVSSYLGKKVDENTSMIGEVGLLGEVRAVPFIEKRIQECERMGMRKIIIPNQNVKMKNDVNMIKVRNIKEIKEELKF